MKCYSFIVLFLLEVLLIKAINSAFLYKNDFDQALGSYKSSMSQNQLRASSIFKRRLQLLGFYPIVLNDDGLQYVSGDPYLFNDDYDDEMYEMLKKAKKEKKARKKASKKKSKKSENKTSKTKIETTTIQPNIVYYWPFATFQPPFDTKTAINENDDESSEENSSETDSSLNNDKQKPEKINYGSSFGFEGRLNVEDDDNNDDDKETRAADNKTANTSATSMSTSTTTPFPLLTIFPDPQEVAIQEIVDQQEIVNKISDGDQGNITKTVFEKDRVDQSIELTRVSDEDNLTETSTILPATDEVPSEIYDEIVKDENEDNSSIAQDMDNKENILEENEPTEANPILTSDEVTESSTISIPSGVLQFFHETLPELDIDESFPTDAPSSSEIDEFFISLNTAITDIFDEVQETTEININIDGHHQTHTEHTASVVQLNETTTNAAPIQPVEQLDKNNSSERISHDELEIPIPIDNITNEAERYEYLIDPKDLHASAVVDDIESRSFTNNPDNKPVDVVLLNEKTGRRSDTPIEANDINEEDDTTDDLPYNLADDNLLEPSGVIENTSAEISTPPPPAELLNFDNIDQFDAELLPLIPIIIKQMKQGNVSPEEMAILENKFGQFWTFIVEEASRENDSSEEMNPVLSEVLNSINKRIVKREATPTFGTWRRPIYGRRIYIDDDDDYVPRRRYYGRRRRPIIAYYKKK